MRGVSLQLAGKTSSPFGFLFIVVMVAVSVVVLVCRLIQGFWLLQNQITLVIVTVGFITNASRVPRLSPTRTDSDQFASVRPEDHFSLLIPPSLL